LLGAGDAVFLIQNGATWRVIRNMEQLPDAGPLTPALDDARSRASRPLLREAAFEVDDRR
jgi:hypothetical protein